MTWKARVRVVPALGMLGSLTASSMGEPGSPTTEAPAGRGSGETRVA